MDELSSILTSIKKMLGIDATYTQFDSDIIIHINAVFMTLNQLGVGPQEGFSIEDDTSAWTDFLDDSPLLNTVKTYMYLKVKLLFDPPASSSTADSMKRMADECEWRMNITVN